MKFLRKFLDKIEPNFKKGGKLSFLESTYDAFSSFLFVPNETTHSGSHIRDAMDLKRTMIVVIMALVPATIFGMWNIGHQHYLSIGDNAVSLFDTFLFGFIKVLPLIIVSYVVGLSIEFAFAQINGHKVNEGFLVTGMLIPLIVPPDIPLWMLAVATAFAVVIGKEVFGGTGMNIFNPALIARAFLFFAYPAQMSGDVVWIAEKGDAISGATPLAIAAAQKEGVVSSVLPDAWQLFIGNIPGSVGETSTIAILIGAAILLLSGIGNLRIMLSVFAGGYVMGLILNAWGTNPYMDMPAYYHLIIGGFAFGAVFMATDPVTASQTSTGKIIYGFLIGIFAVLIRVLNPAYPEGMMLSILLMNTFAPLIDHYVVGANIKRRLKRAKANI